MDLQLVSKLRIELNYDEIDSGIEEVGLGIDLPHVIDLGIDLGIVLNCEKKFGIWESTYNMLSI